LRTFAEIFLLIMTKKAIIVGATGLIGSRLLKILLANHTYGEVLVIGRKKIRTKDTKLTQLVVEFEHLDHYAASITGDVLFCCIGTTRHQTPDKAEYRKIDHDYPLALAEIAVRNGIEQYHLVSAIGANAKSSRFYPRIKGETEEDIKNTGLKSLHIYQPSILIGRRKKIRLLESLAIAVITIVSPVLIGSLRKYRAIKATTVAAAMFKLSLKYKPGVFTYTSDIIKQNA
jgi:uncharacterized protein YbjT (DUF2867 family)